VRIGVLALLAMLALSWGAPRRAAADNVDTLIGQLREGGDRERLAAAINLVKLGDPKAILPLAKAVIERNESSEDVRQVAAQGLGTLVKASTSGTIRSLVIKNLTDAAQNDSSAAVKSAANASISALGGSAPTSSNNTQTAASGSVKAVYVNVGPMSSKASRGDSKRIMAMMHSTAESSLKSTSYAIAWTGGAPSAAQLAAKQTAGFYVDGTLNELDVTTSGGGATISCKVNMLLAEFPSKSMFGFLNGKASVQGGASQKDVDDAAQDCVQAVVENLITKQIIPTIRTKTGISP
jgi:hypothetical protein